MFLYQHYLTSTEQNRKNTANGNKTKRRYLSPEIMHDSSCKQGFLSVFLIGLLLLSAVTIAMLFFPIQLFFFQIIYNICKLYKCFFIDLNTLRMILFSEMCRNLRAQSKRQHLSVPCTCGNQGKFKSCK